MRCIAAARILHAKEGVDGSSPSEGFDEMPANWHFWSPAHATRGYTAGTSLVSPALRGHAQASRTRFIAATWMRAARKPLQTCPICYLTGRTLDPLPAERWSAGHRLRPRSEPPACHAGGCGFEFLCSRALKRLQGHTASSSALRDLSLWQATATCLEALGGGSL